MQKKKVLISSGLIVLIVIGIVVSLGLFLGTRASEPVKFDGSTPITLHMKANFNAERIPPGFDHEQNVETTQKLFGISEATTFSQLLRFFTSNDSITVNQELRKDGDYLVGSGGSIELYIGGKKYNLAIQSSRISHFELKNGHNFLTGDFETGMKRDNGKLYPSTVTFASIIETGDSSFYVPLGVVLAFGDDRFATQEIYDIVRKHAGAF